MFVVVLMSSLLAIIILIIAAVVYIINVISDSTDDADDSDTLPIESDHFLSYPNLSPIHMCHKGPTSQPNHNSNQSEGQLAENDEGMIGPLSSSENHSQSLPENRALTPQEAQDKCLLGSDKPEPSLSELTNVSNGAGKLDQVSQTSDNRPKEDVGKKRSSDDIWASSAATQKSIITERLGKPASKQIFDDFDPKEMEIGGTGLHWLRTRKTLDKLVRLGVPLNLTNDRGETALHVAVRKRKLQVLIGLLCHGAEVNRENYHGENAVIVACKLVDVYSCMLLLVFDTNFDKTDHAGYSARHHISAISDRHKSKSQVLNGSNLILAMLNELGAKRCPAGLTKLCTAGCSHDGNYNGNSYNRWPDFKHESLYKRHMFLDIIDEHKKEKSLKRRKLIGCADKNDSDKLRSRLLCVDGGGMRGIIVCQIMIEIEKYLKRPLISYFDWVGGTSAGAFVCCALCTGIPLFQLRRICFDVKDEVFSGSRPYNSKFLERVLKRTLGTTTRLNDVVGRKLAVTTVLADRDPCQLRFFRNYPSADDLLEHYGYKYDIYNNMSGHSIISVRKPLAMKSDESLGLLSSLSSDATQPSLPTHAADAMNLGRDVNQKSINTQQESKANKSQPDSQNSDLRSRKSCETNKHNKTTSKQTGEPTSGTSTTHEPTIDENERNPYVWQAVRASAAAPFFFKPYGPYLDGGIVSNNPTLDMMSEHQTFNTVREFLRRRVKSQSNDSIGESSKFEDTTRKITDPFAATLNEPLKKLDMVVSLGTGRGRVVGPREMFDFSQIVASIATVFSPVELIRSIRAARDLFRKLLQRSCQTEDHILDRAQSWCSSMKIPYFRINPPLAANMSIDDKRDEQLINAIWQAKLYMNAMKDQLEQLSQLLDS